MPVLRHLADDSADKCPRCTDDQLREDARPEERREHELRRATCERFGSRHFAVKRRDQRRGKC